ncbi:hypothetical protein KI387_019986, partial [Taxus chinensis]
YATSTIFILGYGKVEKIRNLLLPPSIWMTPHKSLPSIFLMLWRRSKNVSTRVLKG